MFRVVEVGEWISVIWGEMLGTEENKRRKTFKYLMLVQGFIPKGLNVRGFLILNFYMHV